MTPGLEKAQRLLTAGEKQMDGASHALAQTDFRLLAKDARSVARRRRLIDKLRRLANELEKQMFGEFGARRAEPWKASISPPNWWAVPTLHRAGG